jgi:hypothetical protein
LSGWCGLSVFGSKKATPTGEEQKMYSQRIIKLLSKNKKTTAKEQESYYKKIRKLLSKINAVAFCRQ